MKVCVVRNAEAESNSDVIRSMDAFTSLEIDLLLLTRSRDSESARSNVIEKNITYRGNIIGNYEIQIESEMDKGLKNLFKLFKYQLKVLTWLINNKGKYNIVHSYDLDTGLPVLLASMITKKPYVYHISDFFVDSRGGIPRLFKKLVRRAEYLIINRAHTTIICTEERKLQIKGSQPQKLYVIHNSPVDVREKKDLNTIHTNKKIKLSYVGGLIDVRFIKEVLESVSENEDVDLVIGGIGPLTDLVQSYANKYPNIDFRGKVSYEEALKIYNKADIIFAIYDPEIPNHKYSAPNKVYEAMMLGKPIIVAYGSGVDKIVETEEMGFVINYKREEFKDLLKLIIKDKDLVKKYSKNSRNAYQKYSWNTMKLKYKEIYSSFQE